MFNNGIKDPISEKLLFFTGVLPKNRRKSNQKSKVPMWKQKLNMDKLMPPRPDRNSISPEHLEYYQNLGKVKWGKLQNGLFSP